MARTSRPRTSCPWPRRRLVRQCLGGLAAALLLAARAVAEISPELLDLSLDDLLQVQVSSAAKYAQPQSQAPSAVSVITAEDIRAQGYRTLADALLSLPGIYAARDHAYTFIGARGFLVPGDYNTRFLLLVDGIRINDNIYEQALFGNEFLVDLDLVERIEYVPGPGSSLYGPNAMFGVVNVVTRPAASLPGARLALRAGSDGERHGRFSWGRDDAGGNSLLVSGSASGWPGRDRAYPDAADLGLSPDGVAHGLDRTRLGSLFWRATVRGWTFQGMWRDRVTHPSSALYGTLFDDRRLRLADRALYLSLAREAEVAAGIVLAGQLQLGQMRYDADYPLADGAGGSYLNVDRTVGRWWNGEARLHVTRFRGHRLVAGLEWQEDLKARQENVDQPPQPASAGILADRRQRRWGLYFQDEWRPGESFLLNVGLRHDHFSTSLRSTSPRFAAIWLPAPATTVKLLAGRAFRPPNAYERDYANGINYLANPSLRPETIRNLELAWEQRLGSRTLVSASLFRYHLDRLIAQTVDGAGALVYRNQEAIEARGVELAAEQRFAGGLRLRGSLARQRVEHADGSRFANSPAWVAKFQATAPLPGDKWTLGWETQWVGGRRWDWNGIPQETGSQAVSHLTLTGRRLAPGLDVSLSVRNVFNRRLLDPASSETGVPRVPQDGRVVVLRLDHAF